MTAIINAILQQHPNIFGSNPKAEKLQIGFTNTLYSVSAPISYIVKICTDYDNEAEFQNEISFYQANRRNPLIPKLYCANTDKTAIPYYYEILEKIPGVSLYTIWHTLDEPQREKIIQKLCEAIRQIHSQANAAEKSAAKPAYNWVETIKAQFTPSYEKAKAHHLFSKAEQAMLEQAYGRFDAYLATDEKDFVLVHNDLHFENIFYCGDDPAGHPIIRLLDFERSLQAPRDFELDILYRMIRKPWKFASEEIEPYTAASQYARIPAYIAKYYPELVSAPNLRKRLAIYDIVYFLDQLIEYPHLAELKNDVLSAAKSIIVPAWAQKDGGIAK